MYKGGVTEILEKLDHDLVGLKPVKKRVREIAALLVLDKMRRKLGEINRALRYSPTLEITSRSSASQSRWSSLWHIITTLKILE